MQIVIGIAVTMLFALYSARSLGVRSEPMYRCDDGTFTNMTERMCAPYEPKGTVLVLPEGASLASMRTLLGEPAAKTAQLPDPASVCTLYKTVASIESSIRRRGDVCEYARRAAVDVPLADFYRDRGAALSLAPRPAQWANGRSRVSLYGMKRRRPTEGRRGGWHRRPRRGPCR